MCVIWNMAWKFNTHIYQLFMSLPYNHPKPGKLLFLGDSWNGASWNLQFWYVVDRHSRRDSYNAINDIDYYQLIIVADWSAICDESSHIFSIEHVLMFVWFPLLCHVCLHTDGNPLLLGNLHCYIKYHKGCGYVLLSISWNTN